MYVPSRWRIWIRLFPRSPTIRRPLRVDVDGVGRTELTGCGTQPTDGAEEPTVPVEDRDPGNGRRRRPEVLTSVPVGDIDGPVLIRHHVVRRVQPPARPVSADAGGADREQQLSLGAELIDRVPLPGRSGVVRVRSPGVGYPNVPVVIGVEPVREEGHPPSEARDHVPLGVDLEDRV